MKNKVLYFVFALAVIAVSTAYARRGSNDIFDGTVNPLDGYAGQIIGGTDEQSPAESIETAQDEFNLFN